MRPLYQPATSRSCHAIVSRAGSYLETTMSSRAKKKYIYIYILLRSYRCRGKIHFFKIPFRIFEWNRRDRIINYFYNRYQEIGEGSARNECCCYEGRKIGTSRGARERKAGDNLRSGGHRSIGRASLDLSTRVLSLCVWNFSDES